jgi:hypothetical protein
MSDSDKQQNNLDALLDGFSMSTSWAKTSPDQHLSDISKFAEKQAPLGERNDKRNRSEKRPRGDNPAFQKHDNFSKQNTNGDASNNAQPRKEKKFEKRDFKSRPPREPQEIPFEIRFLPEANALTIITRKIHSSHKAMPLKSIVKLFQENQNSVLARLEFKEEHKDKRFYQCKKCGWFSMDEAETIAHIKQAHFDECFETVEIEVEPPSGNYPSVARSKITGKLIAPPNHHSYNASVRKMNETECPNIPEDKFRAEIELVRDAAAVEEWKQQASKQLRYMLKLSDKATEEELSAREQMTFEAAGAYFIKEIVSANLNRNRYVIASLPVVRALPHGFMPRSVLQAWDKERHNHLGSLFFAVRGGLKSRKFVIFKIASEHKDEFVVRKQPQVLDVTYAIPELKAVIEYITKNPCCTRGELLSALVPEGTPVEDAKKIISQLNWVTERGHVIEYHNEVLALPEPHPKYRKLQTGSKEKLTLSADAPVETPAPTVEIPAPAVEEPAPQEEAVAAEEPAPTEA